MLKRVGGRVAARFYYELGRGLWVQSVAQEKTNSMSQIEAFIGEEEFCGETDGIIGVIYPCHGPISLKVAGCHPIRQPGGPARLPDYTMTSYPLENARILIDELTVIGSKNCGEVFLGALVDDPHGYDYRRVVVDVTRQHWRQMRGAMLTAGWHAFGEDSLIHDLPGGSYLLADPSF